jgi:septal ring factor EnvC (AmiA/AmiB activator)
MDAAPLASMLGLGAVRAYDRKDLEDFLLAAADQRNRLSAALESANERKARAEQELLSTSRLEQHLTAMMVEAQRELASRRRAAQHDVEAILAAAELEVAARVATARVDAERPNVVIDLSTHQRAEAV